MNTEPIHGPVLDRADIVPGKWYAREDALPPIGLFVLCEHNRGTWHAEDMFGVNLVVLYRRDNINRGAGFDWNQFGPDSFWAHSIDRWMRPTGVDEDAP